MCWFDTVRHIRRVVKRRMGQMTISYHVVEEYILIMSKPVQKIWNQTLTLIGRDSKDYQNMETV